MKRNYNIFFFAGLVLLIYSCKKEQVEISVSPNKEDIAENGYRYTPSTQSFLRGHHWLENMEKAIFSFDEALTADIDFKVNSDRYFLAVKNLSLRYLVPRLHYAVNDTPDDFDYYNLMMAEYSRNGLSFPYGHEGDEMTHFETNLEAVIPWQLDQDYGFKPNPIFKPIRVSVVNNCLNPGLWEINASDKTGEVYHTWFDFPQNKYYDLVAKVNKMNSDKVKNALQWKDHTVTLQLDRLRNVAKVLGEQPVQVINEEISYSSQGSRQKLGKKFVTYKNGRGYQSPKHLSDVLENPVKMAAFVPPGIYSIKEKKDFDFKEFAHPISARISIVEPLTSFSFDTKPFKRDDFKYMEVEINLQSGKKLIVGNLPLNLLVQQEDFTLHGFGVGILSASGFAERRKMLIDQGFHPSFAYLAQEEKGHLVALNSHDKGLEQVFIRSYPDAEQPYWDITFTSYERITDIVKYRIPISASLIAEQKEHTKNYITPVYFSYRDDNLR